MTEQIENPDVAGKALVDIPAAIVANNAYNVDTVTGATVTSTAIETAVAQAIEAAGGNLADYEMKAAEAVEGETVTAAGANILPWPMAGPAPAAAAARPG